MHKQQAFKVDAVKPILLTVENKILFIILCTQTPTGSDKLAPSNLQGSIIEVVYVLCADDVIHGSSKVGIYLISHPPTMNFTNLIFVNFYIFATIWVRLFLSLCCLPFQFALQILCNAA